MTTAAWITITVVTWLGAATALSGVHRWRQAPLADRIAPYLPVAVARHPAGGHARRSAAALVGPVAHRAGDRLARVIGAGGQLSARLARTHARDDTTSFRTRQLGWSLAALGLAATVSLATRPPLALTALCLLGAPVAAFVLLEHRLARASAHWQRRVLLELPVVSEQLAMLLRSGYSLGAAVRRLAVRGSGACARDLATVVERAAQGLGTVAALAEWAATVDVPAVERLVAVVRLGGDGADVGRLLSQETGVLRAEAQRRLVEAIERRTQQVWVPVTVAALVPGVIFLSVPFMAAMDAFSGGGA